MVVERSVDVIDGVAVVRQRADVADATRLRRVGERLVLAAHPGVVEVMSSTGDAAGWELVTEHGGKPVGTGRPLLASQIASVGAQVAQTLADLHGRGIVHGRLDVTRIVVGAAGPRLCGFGPDEQGGTATDDVAALTRILRTLADAAEPRDRDQRDALAELRSRLRDRRTARGLAAELARPAPTRARSRPVAAVAVAAATVVAVGAVTAASSGGGDSPRALDGQASVELPSTSPITPSCVATVDHPIDDGCGFTAVVEEGAVVVDGVRTVLGHGDDEIAVGDWDCDGIPEPVLLRRGSGEVLVFGAADATGGRAVVRTQRVPGALGLTVGQEAGCASLAVRTGANEVVPVEPA